MRRKSAVRFEVTKGESITITVTPISVGAFVAAACNGAPLVDQSPTKKHFQFEFDVTSKVGEVEAVAIAFQFMGSEPASARYEVTISSDDGSSFDQKPIRKPSAGGVSERNREYLFEVV
jgi:hypothetical protein